MKNHIHILLLCLTGVCLLATQDAQAQRPLLRPPGPTPADRSQLQTAEQQTVLENVRKKAKAGRVTVFHFDQAALEDQSMLLSLPTGETLEVVLDERDLRAKADFSWHGHLKGRAGSAVFTFLEGQLSGNLIVGSKSYAISPLGKGACIVYEIENAQLPKDHPNDYREDASVTTPMHGGDTPTADHCGVVRLLVAFTPAAERGAVGLGYSNIKLFVQQAISETNQTYLNSRVGHRVSLAAAIRVSYSESGNFDTDLSRFRGTSDGYMDEVHTYRNRYTADVGVLLLDNPSYCGLASGIGSSASTAFCAVHFSCALGNYTFGHEIGHLHGCRHNPESDGTLTPYAYGHGFCYGPGNWRTIMSYPSCGSSPTRLPYWSNPNVTYGGIAMGTDARHNNARVLNETAGILAGFRVSPTVLALTAAESLIGNETGFATATAEVILSPGFIVAGNSELRIAVMAPACDPPMVAARTGASGAEVADKEDILPESALQLSPVPTSGTLTIRVNLPKSEVVDIGLYNMLGNRLQDVYSGEVAQKQFSIYLKDRPQGLYIVRLRTTTRVITKKAVLQK